MTTATTVIGGTPGPWSEALVFRNELRDMGCLKPVIDRCYPSEHMVEVHRYVETGHKKANVVITVTEQASRRRRWSMDMHTIRRVGALQERVPAASGRPLRGQDCVGMVEADGVLRDNARSQGDAATTHAVRLLHGPSLLSCHAPSSIENIVKIR